MNVKVKICGIRTKEAALAAVDAGADFLGFNFVPTSKRYIIPEKAKKIINVVGAGFPCPSLVGVFQNESIEKVKRIIKYLKLDFVQLHGDESPKYCKKLKQYAGVIKAFRMTFNSDVESLLDTMKTYEVDYYLLDREKQGEGEMVDLAKAKIIARELPMFLAGGLILENVSEAVTFVQPYAVDVAGGIETDKTEDVGKIKKFILQVK